jgi:hypothetical protein
LDDAIAKISGGKISWGCVEIMHSFIKEPDEQRAGEKEGGSELPCTVSRISSINKLLLLDHEGRASGFVRGAVCV